MNESIVVCGAGGFIGGHLVSALVRQGVRQVRAVDIKPRTEWFQVVPGSEVMELDLRRSEDCERAVDGIDVVFNLASDMGGMGFIESNKAACMLSVLINTHLLMASRLKGVTRYFFASSACVYAAGKQTGQDTTALREADAYPAMPEDGYGWEKLFGERMCRHFGEDFGVATRVARYHNVYGPHGAFVGGREKAPAAICRKVIEAKLSGARDIVIWGNGRQARSFMFIDDCIDGTLRLARSDVAEPINIGRDELVTIDELVTLAEEIAGLRLERRYDLSVPIGVNHRNSDNTLIRERLGWEPSTPLQVGLERTYAWIHDQLTGVSH